MQIKRNQSGFTLVELLVTILCGTIVFAAAVTILLMGLRMNAKNTADAKRQNEVRIFFTMLEEMAAEGTITSWSTDSTTGDWKIGVPDGETITAIVSYNKSDEMIRSRDSVMIEGVVSSTLNSSSANLLTVYLEFEDGSEYITTLYFRFNSTLSISSYLLENPPSEASGTYSARTEEETSPRSRFLSILVGELGSTGTVAGTDLRYSRWYTDRQGCGDWPEDTPWCACFLSWATAQLEDGLNSAPFFAHVNDGVWGFNGLGTSNGAQWSGQWHGAGEYTPIPGDFIFFELDGDPDTDHVGAVFSVTADTVYTIEGNVDGKVTVCSYPLNDPTIRGYGVLDWAEP